MKVLGTKIGRCKFCDRASRGLSSGQLKIASQYQYSLASQEQNANKEDAMGLATSDDKEGDEGGDSGDDTSVEEKSPTDKYYNELIGHSLQELHVMGTARDKFDKATQYQINKLDGRIGRMKLENDKIKMESWPDNAKEIKYRLQDIDPNYSEDVFSWGKLR